MSNPRPFELQADISRRNNAVASRAILPGETILLSNSLSTVLLPAEKGVRCDECLVAPATTLKRCSGCLSYWYCSSNCQTTSWDKHHRRICKKLHRYLLQHHDLPEATVSDSVLVAQLIAQHLISPEDVAASETYLSPNGNISSDLEDPLRALFSLTALPTSTPLPPLPPITSSVKPSPEAIKHLLQTIGNNHWVIATSYLKSIANGIFPLASRSFNHSCLPNASPSYASSSASISMSVVALSKIAQDEEITVSYVDPALPYSSRQDLLKRSYGFACDCPRCSMESGILPIPAPPLSFLDLESKLRQYVLPSLAANGRLLPPTAHASLPLTPISIDTFPRSLRPILHESFMPALSKRFSESSHDPSDVSSILSGTSLLALYMVVYPFNHPLIGLHALEVAKTSWNIIVSSTSGTSGALDLLLLSDLLDLAQEILKISLPTGITDGTGPWDEITTLKTLVDAERASA